MPVHCLKFFQDVDAGTASSGSVIDAYIVTVVPPGSLPYLPYAAQSPDKRGGLDLALGLLGGVRYA